MREETFLREQRQSCQQPHETGISSEPANRPRPDQRRHPTDARLHQLHSQRQDSKVGVSPPPALRRVLSVQQLDDNVLLQELDDIQRGMPLRDPLHVTEFQTQRMTQDHAVDATVRHDRHPLTGMVLDDL